MTANTSNTTMQALKESNSADIVAEIEGDA
jgi:hypothetical protein